MAIKGKSKTRGGRPRTNAPRPVVVAPKKPFLARRSTRWGAIALVLTIVAVTLLLAWRSQNAERERERQGAAIDQVDQRVTLAVQSVAQPGAGTALTLLPEFTAQLEAFKAGDVNAQQLRETATGVPAQLETAAQVLGEIEVPDELRNTEYTVEVIDARDMMVEGLNSMRVAVRLTLTALDLEGPQRAAILDRASEQVAIATRLFDYGHSKIVNIRSELGTLSGSDFNIAPPTGG